MTEPYYEDDLVSLFHGDCRDIREWLAADVLVTDPPYGVDRRKFNRRSGGSEANVIAGEKRTGDWHSDRVLGPEHVAVRDEVLALWGARPAIAFGHWRAPRPVGTRMRLIWDREWTGNGGVRPWRPVDEEIYIVGDWPNPDRGPRGRAVPSILRHRAYTASARNRPDHPTPKPVSLMVDLIQHCPPGVIADPFAGSGATMLAARDLGRRVIGVELEERYCELIASRLSQDALPLEMA